MVHFVLNGFILELTGWNLAAFGNDVHVLGTSEKTGCGQLESDAQSRGACSSLPPLECSTSEGLVVCVSCYEMGYPCREHHEWKRVKWKGFAWRDGGTGWHLPWPQPWSLQKFLSCLCHICCTTCGGRSSSGLALPLSAAQSLFLVLCSCGAWGTIHGTRDRTQKSCMQNKCLLHCTVSVVSVSYLKINLFGLER